MKPSFANPLAGNRFETRADLQRAVLDLVRPIMPFFSEGRARVRLGSFGAAFPHADAELEGFARPLFGLAPLAAGGGDFDGWSNWVAGLEAGSDPDHPEHWTFYEGRSQAMVEQAAIGLALALVPERLWAPLDTAARRRLVGWLGRINRYQPVDNNWQFFRVLVNLGLERIGEATDETALQESLDKLESYHLGDGWYQDGAMRGRDHYIGWAMHAYALIHVWARPGDERSKRFAERACAFAQDFEAWFDSDGGVLPFGRSLTYRFAAAGFWSACVLADVEALPWGRIKGHLHRHLRWWARQPISDRDGVLSIGWCYNNPWMREEYNSAGSPYWAMKAFLCLAQPDDHPFWSAPEEEMPATDAPHPIPHAGMVIAHDAYQAIAVSGGHDSPPVFNQMQAKYGRLVYSSRFPFSLDLRHGISDSALIVEEPDRSQQYQRRQIEAHEVRALGVYSRWRPCDGVSIESVVAAGAPWHRRLHRIRCDRPIRVIETGFTLALDDVGAFTPMDYGEHGAGASAARGATAIVDLMGMRGGRVMSQPPNASLEAPFSVVPRLAPRLPPGAHELGCAVGVSPEPEAVAPGSCPSDLEPLGAWLDEKSAR